MSYWCLIVNKKIWWNAAGRAILVSVLLILCGCGSPSTHNEGSPNHHVEGGFLNPPGSPEYAGSFSDTIAAYTDRIMESVKGYKPVLSPEYILGPNDVQDGLARVKGADSLTWLGHSSFLIELDGKMILTDPFLSDYATMLPPFGPKRATPPALTVEQLPQIDILVVSHNHYDHLDVQTIEALPRKNTIRIIVPTGMGIFFTDRGYTTITELDWFDKKTEDSITVTALPAIHGSGRGLFDRDEVLWASYLFKSGSKQVYFACDTAYGPVYPEIGIKIGPVDYALVPIGVYEPRQRMKSVHVNPEEAFRIGQDLQAKKIVGMHWGTIRLSNEAFEEPSQHFREVADKNGFNKETAWVLKIGESRLLN